ncbi:hypothetical protein ABET41_08985 [Metabacillus fastidiosus]|uniref:hypothetical protein n=1 Tax=Metabacillus fastidiosus TaxID=1458 RepID=UPI003D276E17
MRFSKQSLGNLIGKKEQARRKTKPSPCLDKCFEKPIIHRQILGDKVYVPLNLNRVWNELN